MTRVAEMKAQAEALEKAQRVLKMLLLHHESRLKGALDCTQEWHKKLRDDANAAHHKLTEAFFRDYHGS